MSRKRKKKAAGMTDNAAQAMYEYGKEKYELATRVTRGVDSVGTLAFAQHCSSYAKDGFKKGYDFAKAEDVLKDFDVQKEITRFYDEMADYFRERGFYIGQDSVEMSFGPTGTNIKVTYTAMPNIDILKKRYIIRTFGDWRERCCGQCRYHKVGCGIHKATCVFSQCSDKEAFDFTKTRGCQGVREYLETGIFPERGRKY